MATMSIPFSEAVKNNSFWAENGVLPGDIIKTIDGKALTMANAQQMLTEVFMWKPGREVDVRDRKSTRLNSSHGYISYAVFCLKKKKNL